MPALAFAPAVIAILWQAPNSNSPDVNSLNKTIVLKKIIWLKAWPYLQAHRQLRHAGVADVFAIGIHTPRTVRTTRRSPPIVGNTAYPKF